MTGVHFEDTRVQTVNTPLAQREGVARELIAETGQGLFLGEGTPMLQCSFPGASRWLMVIVTMSTLALVSACQFVSSDAATDDRDRAILGGNHTAIQMNVSGQSTMLATNCTRELGRELWKAKQRGASMDELRQTLRDRCSTNPQSVMNRGQGIPARGRLFAPVREATGGTRTYSDNTASVTYYSWFWRPFWWWSPEPVRNVQWCRRFFNNEWNDGSCFSLFYDFVTYEYYKPYCFRHCTVWAQTSYGSGNSSTATSRAWDRCVSAGCYGQWWWRY